MRLVVNGNDLGRAGLIALGFGAVLAFMTAFEVVVDRLGVSAGVTLALLAGI